MARTVGEGTITVGLSLGSSCAAVGLRLHLPFAKGRFTSFLSLLELSFPKLWCSPSENGGGRGKMKGSFLASASLISSLVRGAALCTVPHAVTYWGC